VSEAKNFTSYSQERFDVEDQKRLAEEFERLTRLGVKCLLSNSDCDLIRDLYKCYTIKTLNVNYYIQPTSDDIKRQEVLILNF
jgi:DNA adenine methylase